MDINQPVQDQQNPAESQSSSTGQSQEPAPNSGAVCCGGGKNRNLIFGIIALVVLVGGAIVFTMLKSEPSRQNEQTPGVTQTPDTSYLPSSQQAQSQAAQPEEDSTAAISQQLNNIVVTDLDSQFKDIDTDLNSL